MQGMIIGHGSEDHIRQYYKITDENRMHHQQSHVTATPISAEDYLKNEVWKGNKQQSDDKLSKVIDIFPKI